MDHDEAENILIEIPDINEEQDIANERVARNLCLCCLGCVFTLLTLSLFIYLYLHKTRELNG